MLNDLVIPMSDNTYEYQGYHIILHLGCWDIWQEETRINSIDEEFYVIEEAISYVDQLLAKNAPEPDALDVYNYMLKRG